VNWGSWDNFLAMGGYAFYVWGSYGVTAVLIVVEILLLQMRTKAARKQLAHAAAARNETRA
jgi:heme exporter protein D